MTRFLGSSLVEKLEELASFRKRCNFRKAGIQTAYKPRYPGRLPGYLVPKPKPMRVLLYMLVLTV